MAVGSADARYSPGMLWFERQVVAALSPTGDRERRSAIERYVDGALGDMPSYLRAGVAAESMLLGASPRVAQALGRLDRQGVVGRLDRWERSPVGPVRQYVRLLRSLVLFAEHELVLTDRAPQGPNASTPATG